MLVDIYDSSNLYHCQNVALWTARAVPRYEKFLYYIGTSESYLLTIMRSTQPVNSGLPYGILVLEQVQSNRSGYLRTFVLVTVPTLHTEIDKTSRGW